MGMTYHPFPGDWHFLKNFQEVLLKIYFDAGMNDLAGYQTNSIGSNFKRTHHFLLESWESVYRLLMSNFLSKDETPSDFLECTSNWIKYFPVSPNQESTFRNHKQLLEDISDNFNSAFKHIWTKKQRTMKH